MSTQESKQVCRAYKYNKPGRSADVLYIDEKHVVPELGADEVMVRVAAAALNPVDWKLMKMVPRFVAKYPSMTGVDYSGTIIKSNSPLFAPGDEVFGLVSSELKFKHGTGTLADVITGPASTCAKRPTEKLSTIDVSGVSCVGLTALAMVNLMEKHAEKNKEKQQETVPRRVLVCGGSTAVGLSLIPMLKAKGYHVAATCSQPKAELVRSRGADGIFDYRSADIHTKLSEDCQKTRPFDYVLDTADSFGIWQNSPSFLTESGLFINVGFDAWGGMLAAVRRLVSYFLQPKWLGGVPRQYTRVSSLGGRKEIDELQSLLASGTLKPVTDSVWAFDKAIDAFAYLEGNRAAGKVVIRVAAEA